jgi:hypothetical protein
MELHGHLRLDPVVRSRLLDVSAATIDRLLHPEREATGRMRRRRWGMGSAVRQSVPVRTFADWGRSAAGLFRVRPGGTLRWREGRRQLRPYPDPNRHSQRLGPNVQRSRYANKVWSLKESVPSPDGFLLRCAVWIPITTAHS